MNRKDFDSLLQNKLNNFSSPYSEQVWQNLEKELDRDKDKIGFIWFLKNNLSAFFLLFAISCIAAYGYYQYSLSEINLPANLELKNAGLKLESKKETEKPEINTNSNKPLNENTEPIALLNTNTHKTEPKTATKSLYIKSTAINANGLSNTNRKSLLSYSGINHQGETSNNINTTNDLTRENVSSDKLETNDFNVNKEVATISSQKIMSVKSAKRHTKLSDNLFPNTKRNCPSFNTNVPDYYLEIFASPDYTFRSITSKDAEYNDYKNARVNSETEILGYSLGIRGELALRNGLSVKTGLTFSNIREKFQFTIIGEKISKTMVIPSDTIHYGSGSVSYTYDTIHYIEIGNRSVVAENIIKTIEIPFIMAYQFDFTRWTLQINAGVGVQISNIQHGYVLTPSLEPNTFTPADLDHLTVYKRQWGLNFLGGIQLGYKLTGQLEVFAEPYAKFYPTSVTVDGYPLAQKMLTLGTNFGLKYRL